MIQYKIFPKNLSGSVILPGDKSISQRVSILCGMADGQSHISGFLNGQDSISTLIAMESLGINYKFITDTELIINGVNGHFRKPNKRLDLGNSGTGTRLLTGLISGLGLDVEIIGDKSLSSRPMDRIKIPLERMGAKIFLSGKKNTLPMKIISSKLKGITYYMPIASAQVKSCLLFAGLYAEGITTIIEPSFTRDHTEKLFDLFDIPLDIDDRKISIQGFGKSGPKIKGKNIKIPGDFSSAAFWIVAVAGRVGSKLEINNIGLNSKRIALLEVLKRMGAKIDIKYINNNYDPNGSIFVEGTKLKGTIIEGDEIPNLIDELPILAVAGSIAEGKTIINDAEELRFKESDRISVMVKHLRSFGVKAIEKKDGMEITGTDQLFSPNKLLDSHDDHRIAMSLAILNTYANDEITIKNVECVDTSYPSFWEHLNLLGGKAIKL